MIIWTNQQSVWHERKLEVKIIAIGQQIVRKLSFKNIINWMDKQDKFEIFNENKKNLQL